MHQQVLAVTVTAAVLLCSKPVWAWALLSASDVCHGLISLWMPQSLSVLSGTTGNHPRA